jgi:glycosyltransferase involved in cell wall biosynthesis
LGRCAGALHKKGIFKVKVALVHNSYQIKGGEDTVFANEFEMLSKVAEVCTYELCNSSINTGFEKARVAIESVFSISSFFKFISFIRRERPDIVHVHNYFPMLSPSIFYACKLLNVPVVHTLHNFRAICPTALLMHEGVVCERSIHKSVFWSLKHKVYRDSFLGTFTLCSMVELHKFMGTWNKMVDGFIALTEFSKNKYIQAGWPESKIYVKPNFVANKVKRIESDQSYILYVGRLSEEKGIKFILESLKGTGINLKIAGGGPLEDYVVKNIDSHIEFLGALDKVQVSMHMSKAKCLVMASTWYEGFPMVIVEALSHGLPIVVPNLGNMAAVVKDGVTGFHFEPHDPTSFLSVVQKLLLDEELWADISNNAYIDYDKNYTESINREELLG